MREIKFRVFDGTNIHYINHEEGLQIAFGSHHQSYSVWNEYEEVIDGDQEVSVLMQYTGLKDKNGTEIFEGDIVQIEGPYGYYYRKIEFEKGSFHFGYVADGMCDYKEMEVIGNIYENPHLLEEST